MLKKTLFFCLILLFLESTAFAQETGGWWQGVDTEPFANGEIREAYCDIIDLMEGSFGGMLMTIAGILAFATAAFGNLKHAITAVVVGISSFAIHAMTSLYFGQLCDVDGIVTDGFNNNLDVDANAAAGVARTSFIPNPEQNSIDDPFDF